MRLNHAHVGVSDLPRSIAFYERLGFELIVRSADYARFVLPDGDSTFSLHLLPPGERVGHATGAIHLECDDLDERAAALVASGVELVQAPTDMPYLWREAILEDPDGNVIFLYRAGKNRLDPPWRLPPQPRP